MLKFDKEKLSSLFEDFYTLTSIHICLFNAEQVEVLRYPENYNSFCALIRQNKTLEKCCKDCDDFAFAKCNKSKERFTYTCHMNLIETATPIVYNEQLVGYIMMGQVKSMRSKFCDIAKNELFLIPDIEKASKLYDKLPVVSDKIIKAAAHILDACAGYLYVSKLISIQSEELKKRIENFVSAHLNQPLSVDSFCTEFHTSRVEIYELFNRFFKMTVAQYLKVCRLNYAQKLLSETTLPISKISAKCGFNDYNYFSKIFKSYFNISASTYRKKLNLAFN